jgi:hypothetical protein
MKISHSAVTSPLFELVKVVELDIQLGEDSWSTRIELFQSTEATDHFRCHVWELELFRLTPSFPRDEDGLPAHISDDVLMVERGIAHRKISYPMEDIVASDVNAALKIVVEDLKRFLERVTGEKAH